jgi:hypothetical protein
MESAQSQGGVSQTCAPTLQVAAKNVGWLKVLFGVGITLLVAGGAAALYAASFATHEEVQTAFSRHESSDGHPSVTKGIQDLGSRLIRLEIGQQTLQSTQQRMEGTQEKMDDKLDRILSGGAAWRSPIHPAAPPEP